jgi:hypothetical protein
MGKRVIVRTNRGMIDGMELNDLGYGALGPFSDGFEETDPNADLLEILNTDRREPVPTDLRELCVLA